MLKLFIFGLVILTSYSLFSFSAQTKDIKINSRPILVELFTSQGCHSCPPADKVLKKLVKQNPNVIALSMHVDYWNYIGWNDPFSKAEFTQRQRDYSKVFSKNIYTPQAAIDGKYQAIGSYETIVNYKIKQALNEVIDIPINVEEQNGQLSIKIDKNNSEFAKVVSKVFIIGYDNKKTTKIDKGENKGKTLTNYNIVTYIKNIGRYYGNDFQAKHDMIKADNIIVILQNEENGILGIKKL